MSDMDEEDQSSADFDSEQDYDDDEASLQINSPVFDPSISIEPSIKENQTKNKKFKHDEMNVDEINNLRETQALYHSNLFRLQLDEMLRSVCLKEKRIPAIHKWFKQLEELVKSFEPWTGVDLMDHSWLSPANVKIPFMFKPWHLKGKFSFFPPNQLKLIGSFALGTIMNSNTVIDIALEIPRRFWVKSDHLNYRYHLKRALYITYLAQKFNQEGNGIVANCHFSFWNENQLKPVLILTPNGKIGKYCSVALHCYPELYSFKPSRFLPVKNNVRKEWFFSGNSQVSEDIDAFPTPYYNSSILQDINLIENFDRISEVVKNNENLKHAIMLMKIWLRQRSLKVFTFVLQWYTLHLISIKKISCHMSSYQMFRSTLLNIDKSNWDCKEISSESQVHLSKHFPVVLLDATSLHNICWEVKQDDYLRLKHEAKLTIESLDSNAKQSFEHAFMKKIDFYTKFDAILQISLNGFRSNSLLFSQFQSELIDKNDDIILSLIPHLQQVIETALSKRISLFQFAHKSFDLWNVSSEPPIISKEEPDFLEVGLLLDEENAFNRIERGPPADSPEAKKFQKFWGEKSELRRFDDGAICECVVWNAKSIKDQRHIIESILKYILNRHFKISPKSCNLVMSQLDCLLQLPSLRFKNGIPYGTGEEISQMVCRNFDSFAKKLRTLDNLPLSISSVQGINAHFRGTEVFPAFPLPSSKTPQGFNVNRFTLDDKSHKLLNYFKPLEVILHLEGSGKWPDELAALRRVKAAFHIEISKSLISQLGLSAVPHIDYFDVFHDGFVYRVTIASNKEISLTQKISTNKASELQMKFEILPKLNTCLNNLNLRNSSFNLTCRITKRWLASQLLLIHFDEIIIDLLVASIFVSPEPFTTPSSYLVGFIRVLALLSESDWKTSPLIVNLNNEITLEEHTAVLTQFSKSRPTLPPMVIITPYDTTFSMWTKTKPIAPILHRVAKLAAITKNNLMNKFQNATDIKVIFRPPLEIYDVIIYLNHEQIANTICAIDYVHKKEVLIKSVESNTNVNMPITGFNPAKQYLKVLESSYSPFALFFYDDFGGDIIGVLWKPDIFNERPFKVHHVNGCSISSFSKVSSNKTLVQVTPNIEAILEDFKILGEGIVEKLDVRATNWKT